MKRVEPWLVRRAPLLIGLLAIAVVVLTAATAVYIFRVDEVRHRVTRLEQHPCRKPCRTEIVHRVLHALASQSEGPSHVSQHETEGGDSSNTGNTPPSIPGPPSGGPPGNPGDNGNGTPNPPVGDPPTTPTPGPAQSVTETACSTVNSLGVTVPIVCP